MKPKPELTTEAAWTKLQQYFDINGLKIKIYDLFQQNPKRFENFRWVLLILDIWPWNDPKVVCSNKMRLL